ncbi:MAG: FAD-linked oxidase C-terminal domain-containing protein [Pseudomonadota bacterium]
MPDTSQPTRNEAGIATVCGILAQRFGERFSTGTDIRRQHAHTTTWIENQPPDGVVFASSTEEVSDIVRIASDHGVPIIPFGTGTSLEGHVNAPFGGISVDVSRMTEILEVHAEDLDCVVQPGVTRKMLNAYLRDTGLFFPIDPGADASLGGMAATRASGTNAVRYGTMRDNVLGLQAVLADGRIIRTGTRARKSSAGYDLTRLLVGSEGTLGIITELTLRLQGIPEKIAAARCSFPTVKDACDTVIATLQMGVPMARIELMDADSVAAVNAYSNLSLPENPLLLLEFHGSEASVAQDVENFNDIASESGGYGFEATTGTEERNKLWQARHDAYWATLASRPGWDSHSTDICVPISRLSDMVTATAEKARSFGIHAPILGHAGDGNFHALLLMDPEKPDQTALAKELVNWMADTALAMGGTSTGEHGVGQGKRAHFAQEAGPSLAVMQAIKTSLDPQGILNPGKILSSPG